MSCLLFALALAGANPAEEWEAVAPFKVPEDKKALAPSVTFDGKTVTVANRGTLKSKKAYPKGAKITATWRWTKGQEEGKYQDHLVLVFFTNAKQPKWPFEVTDGIHVRLNPGGESIAIEHWIEGKDAIALARKGNVVFAKGKDYKLEIDATPTSVAVSIDGKKVLEAEIKEKLGGELIAIYDREPVAAIEKESVLVDLSIRENK